MSVVFGRRATWDDPELAALFETAEEFLALQQPGVNIVDAFPVLAKLPKRLQWWRPRGERIHKKTVGYHPSPSPSHFHPHPVAVSVSMGLLRCLCCLLQVVLVDLMTWIGI